jgi:hypothetical protein
MADSAPQSPFKREHDWPRIIAVSRELLRVLRQASATVPPKWAESRTDSLQFSAVNHQVGNLWTGIYHLLTLDPRTDGYHCANEDATAPAQRVEITDQLPANLDWNTLRFTEAGFGDNVISVPADSTYFATTVSMTYNGETFDVEMELNFDVGTGKVRAVFQSVDPFTFLPPDVLTGFLPPEDGTGRGKGYIGFSVEVLPGLPTGTEIRNVALISFDHQTIIATNQVDPQDPAAGTDPNREALNTIDNTPPTSAIGSLPPLTTSRNFVLSWGGSDIGAGVLSYDIFVSTNGGDFVPLLSNTTNTSTQFEGVSGNQYSFYSVAADAVGNRQLDPPVVKITTIQTDPADFNGNGYVENGDREVWQTSFGQTGQGLDADGNQDGAVNAADYVMWRKNAWRIVHSSMGDYNLDNRIDIGDYYLWQSTFGETGSGLAADGSGNGIIDAADYLIWKKLNRSIVVLLTGQASTEIADLSDSSQDVNPPNISAVDAETLRLSGSAIITADESTDGKWDTVASIAGVQTATLRQGNLPIQHSQNAEAHGGQNQLARDQALIDLGDSATEQQIDIDLLDARNARLNFALPDAFIARREYNIGNRRTQRNLTANIASWIELDLDRRLLSATASLIKDEPDLQLSLKRTGRRREEVQHDAFDSVFSDLGCSLREVSVREHHRQHHLVPFSGRTKN